MMQAGAAAYALAARFRQALLPSVSCTAQTLTRAFSAAAAEPAYADEPQSLEPASGPSSPSGSAAITKKGIRLRGTPLYLDMQATTPMDPRVLDAMLPFMTHHYGNPHSRTHLYGWESEEAVEKARAQVSCPP
ncbi:putative cysteine desulfurase, mitochondrial [Haematococcus lacustris]|uniref:Putative cysteine desulfurase, mitochondrial n=1 Tax=Haematococcus lacustris TaxID=44745 RepID=A0A6A0AA11_HAELA|nr:putative cysteine desulfurase, mitochondrial [Haematococcus lacustris]